ncbi:MULTISPECIES: Crp/Fnr family transcriptional regulator [Pseudoalteromonas]|uniref:Crp/Fnr family transcriptional regulator n=1 Tax=Pseudoalteromonas amylolytica TaxID=1859457 RepID=A0A1S1N3N3_9GAMM|nr:MULTISPECIES: Crp/Fnr family transcriptional regulator [Pseudoalteromonas]OHU90573.1 Crp/Fnr family transcriptional regulator [Pseudoalteromonas sp. JW3]OHU92806.1 Crp/Fnr family transcriptional regulator [Pseudoalteromonas amylolytica]
MKQVFINFLNQHGFKVDEAKKLSQKSEFIELAAGTTIIHQGDKVDSLYFMIEGLCHACYLTVDGKRFSKEFYWTGDCMINFESLIQQKPAPYLIETLEPSHLIKLPITTVQKLRKLCHPFYLHLAENQLLHKENKERFMLLNNPEQRYKLFCRRFHDLETRLSDYQIASYIGVTPISLSRIKKRLQS